MSFLTSLWCALRRRVHHILSFVRRQTSFSRSLQRLTNKRHHHGVLSRHIHLSAEHRSLKTTRLPICSLQGSCSVCPTRTLVSLTTSVLLHCFSVCSPGCLQASFELPTLIPSSSVSLCSSYRNYFISSCLDLSRPVLPTLILIPFICLAYTLALLSVC